MFISVHLVCCLNVALSYLLKFFVLLLDENECNMARSPCDLNANCINSDGSFQCECKSGFTGDGFRCIGGLLTVKCYNSITTFT